MRNERVPLVKEMLADSPQCALRSALTERLRRPGSPAGAMKILAVCRVRADCVHERRKRGQGGSMTNRANLAPLCSPCNGAIESDADVARFAHEAGLVVKRGDLEWAELGADRDG